MYNYRLVRVSLLSFSAVLNGSPVGLGPGKVYVLEQVQHHRYISLQFVLQTNGGTTITISIATLLIIL